MVTMRSTRIPVMALSMLMTIAISAHPAPDQAANLYTRYVAALNAHDVNRALSFYSRDTVVLQQGTITPVDLNIVRGYREFEAATEAHFDTRIASATDDRVEVFETEANQFQRAIGAGPVTSHWIYRFHNGRILELVHLNAPDPIYLERYRAFRDWIVQQPAVAVQLIAKGDLVFDGATAAMMLDRGRQWSDAHPASAVAAAQTTGAPDLILVNGKVFTANPQAPWAEAIAIRGDRIAAVGTSSAIRERAAANTRIVDVGGRVVVPGINDAHTHVGARPPGAVLKLKGSDPTLTEVLAAIRETAASAPPGLWLYGTVGESFLSDPNGTRFTLDQAAPGRLIKLSAWTGHGVTFSTPGLRAIGIDDRDSDPPFGRYRRTADGVLDGRLDEYADLRAHRRLAALAGRAAAVASLRNVAAEAVGYGITTIQAMGNALTAADLATMLPEAASAIRWRIIRFPILLTERDAPEDFGTLPRNPAPLITVSGVKWILDGTPVERLAAMNEPYGDRAAWTGTLNMSPAQLDDVLRRALAGGDQPMFHIVGDRAIDLLLSSMERLAPAERWQRLRVRIEHGEFLTRDRFERVKRLGIVNVQNPAHLTIPEIMTARFGAQRAATAEPLKSIVAAGIPLALGGDGPLNPFLNMMFAIAHPNNPSEALTREQVITAYTAGSAYAEFEEREKGQLKAGMLADAAVLTQDIFTVETDKLPATAAAMTLVNGRVVRDTLTP
jgi:predicted amidohydrolase YtcJ